MKYLGVKVRVAKYKGGGANDRGNTVCTCN